MANQMKCQTCGENLVGSCQTGNRIEISNITWLGNTKGGTTVTRTTPDGIQTLHDCP